MSNFTQFPTRSSASSLTPPDKPTITPIRPLSSVTASASRLTRKTINRPGHAAVIVKDDWQRDAWEMFDLVGEQHFLITTLANRTSQARFYVGELQENSEDAPIPLDPSHLASQVFEAFGGNAVSRSKIIERLSVNLSTAGDGWLVGIPNDLLDRHAEKNSSGSGITPTGVDLDGDKELDLTDMEWRMLSVDEISRDRDGKVTLILGGSEEDRLVVDPDEVYLVRVWKSHPRFWWLPDSPTKSNLPVLRELVGLTMHISAQVDSRLAGAGVLIVPQSAADAFSRATGSADLDDDVDPLMEALMEAMITPIQDRSSAAAYVPLLLKVPDEAADKFHHIKFSNELDGEARNLRDEAIRRLALGQDAPPEILLGVGGMNHWGAWLVREDVVNTHLEPSLALMCDALTTQYLWPVLEQQGLSREEARKHAIWYTVDHLIARPNRSKDALDLYDRDAITTDALRDALNFAESDAPEVPEVDPAVDLAISMMKSAPSLATDPGFGVLIEQIRQALSGEEVEDPEESEETQDVETPDDSDSGPIEEEETDDSGGLIPDTDQDDANAEVTRSLVASSSSKKSLTNTISLESEDEDA